MRSETNKGLMVVISGPAGSGKGTVVKELLPEGNFAYSVSATTRAPRPGEVNDVNYHFITKPDFERHIENGEMLEYTIYCGEYYGTFLQEAEQAISGGKDLLLEIEVEGAANVKKTYPEAVTIMLLPPSFAEQEKRLRGRGTETEEKIQKRLNQTRREMTQLKHYDYVVYNMDGGVSKAVEQIRTILAAERLAMHRHPDVAKNYFEE